MIYLVEVAENVFTDHSPRTLNSLNEEVVRMKALVRLLELLGSFFMNKKSARLNIRLTIIINNLGKD